MKFNKRSDGWYSFNSPPHPVDRIKSTQPSKHPGTDTNQEWYEPPVLPLPTAKYIFEHQPVHQRHYTGIAWLAPHWLSSSEKETSRTGSLLLTQRTK